jgi:hypothetical protein
VERSLQKNKREDKRFSWTSYVYDYEPSGLLAFHVGGYRYYGGKTWRDGKTRKLENLLSEVVAELMLEGRRKRIAEEEKSWVRAKRTRRFIDALEKKWKSEGIDLSSETDKGRRIIWMREQADRLDPMTVSPSSILDRKQELRRFY